MTVSATNAFSGPYTGNGTATAFAFTFKAEDASEVSLEVNGAPVAATIVLAGEGGTATAATAPASGAVVYVRSQPSFQQNIALTNNGAFLPSVIEEGFDRAAQRDIYLKGLINALSATVSALSLTVSSVVAAAQAAAQAVINAAVFVVTSAPGQSVTTRGLLAGITSPTSGQTAYLAEAGREGWFKFSTANLSTSVTADTTQAIYVAPSSATTGASGAWVRVEAATVAGVKATWFGTKGDGVTDDTAAIQAAINYLAATGGGTLWVPPGHFMVNGTLQDVSNSNAQILWPRIQNVDATIAIRIKGASPAPMTCNPLSGSNFTIIESNLTSVGSVFGGKSSGGFQNRTCISLYLEDLIVRLPQNSAAIAIDLRWVHMNKLDNVRVDVPNVATCIQPTNSTNVGIYSPLNNVSAWSVWNNVLAAGYYRGFRIGELVAAPHIHSSFCLWPISTQVGAHAAIILSALITNCPNTILTDGALQLKIVECNIEHDKTAAHSGSGPDWVELGVDQTATRTGYDIFDSDGSLSGDITFQMHDTSIPLHIHTGATNIRWRDLKSAGVQSYGRLFPGMSALTNAASVCAVRGMNGGWPWQSFIQASTTLTDQVGVISFAGPTGTDTRVAQINVGYDGATDAGKYTLTVFKSGAANTALTIPSTGHVVPGVLPNAANDTAAAALTPPVPVGGLYRNGNAVQVRLV